MAEQREKRPEKSLNKVMIIGRLGRDPELRYTANGMAVATLAVATNDSWQDRETNQWQDRTEWHRVVAWDRIAEICGEYMSKGKRIYIEGRLQTREWEDKDGIKRWTTEIVARDIIMLDSRGESFSPRFEEPPHPADTHSAGASPSSGSTMPPAGGEEDIPF
jgi:single-strand DNA-binding protein